MKDAKGNHGLFVRGAGTCVTATNCKFTGNGMSGVAVLAQVRLFPCQSVSGQVAVCR